MTSTGMPERSPASRRTSLAASLDAFRAEFGRAAHAALGIEDLYHPDGRAVAEAADEARLTVRIPAEQHARGLAVHDRDFAGLRAARVPRLPRPALLAVAILAADLDGAGRLPRRERPVQDPGIRAGPRAPLLTAGRALRGAALRTGGTDDRVLRACRADDGAEQNRRHAERAASHPSFVSRRASPR